MLSFQVLEPSAGIEPATSSLPKVFRFGTLNLFRRLKCIDIWSKEPVPFRNYHRLQGVILKKPRRRVTVNRGDIKPSKEAR